MAPASSQSARTTGDLSGDGLTFTVETVRGVHGSARSVTIPLTILNFSYSRSSGPGGQNVNKVNTRAELRVRLIDLLDALRASGLLCGEDDALENRLRQFARRRLNKEDEIVIATGRFRSQIQNRDACIETLVELIAKAVPKPRTRRKTKPSRASKERRLEAKHRRGTLKSQRQSKRLRPDD